MKAAHGARSEATAQVLILDLGRSGIAPQMMLPGGGQDRRRVVGEIGRQSRQRLATTKFLTRPAKYWIFQPIQLWVIWQSQEIGRWPLQPIKAAHLIVGRRVVIAHVVHGSALPATMLIE